MTSGQTIQMGIQSFQDLGSAFVNTVMRRGAMPTEYACCRMAPDGTLRPSFFLDWTDPHVCGGSDWIIVLFLTAIIHVISWTSRWLLWEPLADWRMKGHKSWNTSEKKKFSMACTSAMFFIIASIAGWRVFSVQEWLWDPDRWNENLYLDRTLDAAFKFHYLLYAARFSSDFLSIFFEERRFDTFLSVFAHHTITMVLVLLSAHAGLHRIGGVVMFFFDWADPFLQIAKCLKYISKHPQDIFQSVANVMFVLFALSFFVTHNVMFNFVVRIAFRDIWGQFQGNICVSLLFLLAILQTYWLGLLCQAVYKQVKNGGNVEDVREEKKKKDK